MQSSGTYRLIWILVCFVLATGLIFPPLMDYDAAEYAGIAMSMYQRNDWLNCDPDDELLFGTDHDAKYDHAMRKIGIDPRMLSGEAGHA